MQLLTDAGYHGEKIVFITTHTYQWIMHSPLSNIGTAMTCDGKNWVGWPCDQTAEKLRQDFLEAAGIDAQTAAAVRLHPYRALGQYDQPVAMRADLSGFLSVPVIVYWNIEKKQAAEGHS